MRRTAFNKIARKFSNNLYRFVLFHIKDEATSQDIVQEAFIKLWECRKDVDAERALSWLYSTCRNLFLNYQRHKKVVKNHAENFEYTPYMENNQFENSDLIKACIEGMSETQKTIILLRDLEGYDYRSIADIMKLSESQVKVYLFRARKKFRDTHERLLKQSKEVKNG